MISDGFLVSKDLYVQTVGYGTVATAAPASGSYIDVSKFERFAFKIYVSAGQGSDLISKVQQADAADGTLKDVTVGSSTATVTLDTAAKDYIIEVDVSHLDINAATVCKYVTLVTSSTFTGHVEFIGYPKKTDRPVTWPALGEAGISVG